MLRCLAAGLLTVLVLLGEVRAEVKIEAIEYQAGETVCAGVVAYDPAAPGKRPGVLIVHDWLGISGETRRRAELLAGLGYVAFCADVYGKGVRPSGPQEAGPEAGKYKKDPALLLQRLTAAYATLAKHEKTDPKRLAAIGYCFGGSCALEMARAGMDLAGVVSFHGGLSTTQPAQAGTLKARILVLHGADDPFVPAEDLAAFEKEMREAKADWQLTAYGNSVHSFTNPNAGSDNAKGAAYNEKADRRSWEAMRGFFEELWGKK